MGKPYLAGLYFSLQLVQQDDDVVAMRVRGGICEGASHDSGLGFPLAPLLLSACIGTFSSAALQMHMALDHEQGHLGLPRQRAAGDRGFNRLKSGSSCTICSLRSAEIKMDVRGLAQACYDDSPPDPAGADFGPLVVNSHPRWVLNEAFLSTINGEDAHKAHSTTSDPVFASNHEPHLRTDSMGTLSWSWDASYGICIFGTTS
jgi:hypothetical protein